MLAKQSRLPRNLRKHRWENWTVGPVWLAVQLLSLEYFQASTSAVVAAGAAREGQKEKASDVERERCKSCSDLPWAEAKFLQGALLFSWPMNHWTSTIMSIEVCCLVPTAVALGNFVNTFLSACSQETVKRDPCIICVVSVQVSREMWEEEEDSSQLALGKPASAWQLKYLQWSTLHILFKKRWVCLLMLLPNPQLIWLSQ